MLLSLLVLAPSFAGQREHGAPQQEKYAIRVATGLVSLSVTVTDRKGQAILGLGSGEVSRHYGIGYYPKNTLHDGRWRRIQVVVGTQSGKAGYIVRARAGYYAPKDEAH